MKSRLRFRFFNRTFAFVIPALAFATLLVIGFQNCSSGVGFAAEPSLSTPPQSNSVPDDSLGVTPVNSAKDCSKYVFPGAGTQAKPYEISSEDSFICFVKQYSVSVPNGMFWILTRNLDFATLKGNDLMVRAFNGNLDGQFNRIKNLHIDCKTDRTLCSGYIGLFRETINSRIENLFVDDAVVEVGAHAGDQTTPTLPYIGVLAGVMTTTTISRVSVHAKIEIQAASGSADGMNGIGTLAGWTNRSTITESAAVVTFAGRTNAYSIGAMIGMPQSTSISNSYATGDVKSEYNFVGGLAGASGSGAATLSVDRSFFIGNLNYAPVVNRSDCGVLPLGSAAGEPLNLGRTSITNSFWVGSSSCSEIRYQPSLALADYDAANAQLNGNPSVWKFSSTGWPELKWILEH